MKRTLLKKSEVQARMFDVGAFVMLGTEVYLADDTRHPDAGRIGKIISVHDDKLLVDFWSDDLIGKGTFCILPRKYWSPVPEFLVEEFFPRELKRGYRINARGVKTFSDLGWPCNAATRGEAG